MTIEKHISTLIKTNDMVIIPSLGGLVAHGREASISQSENTISAPGKSFSFNPKLSYQDGLLVQSYMKEHNLSQNEALLEVKIAIDDFKKRLNSQQKIEIREVGNFCINNEGVIVFNETKMVNNTPDMFGLENIYIRKISPKTQPLTPEKQIKEPKQFEKHQLAKWLSVAAVFLFMLLISKPVSDEGISLNMAGPSFDFTPLKSEIIVTPKVEKPSEVKVILKTAAIDSVKIQQAIANALDEVLNYDIIVSSITNKKHAEEKLAYFRKSGFRSAKIIENNGRYRISIGTYSTKNEGLKRLTQIKEYSSRYKDAWILKTATI